MKRFFGLVFNVCLAIGLVIAFIGCASYNPAMIGLKGIESGDSFFTDYIKYGNIPYDKSRARESYAFIVVMPFDMNTRVAEIDGNSFSRVVGIVEKATDWGNIIPLEPGTHTLTVQYGEIKSDATTYLETHNAYGEYVGSSKGYGTRNAASREPASIEFTFEAGRYYYLGGGEVMEALTVGDWEINEISDSVYCRDNVWPAASVIQGMNIALDRALE